MGSPIIIGAAGDINHFNGQVHIQEKLRLLESLILESSRAAKLGVKVLDIAATTLSGGTTNLGTQIPDGALVLGVVLRVTTLITGCSTFKVGDGTDDDRWGTGIALALGTTTSSADFTAAAPTYYASATNIVLTAVGGGASFSAGVVRGAMFYVDVAALTS